MGRLSDALKALFGSNKTTGTYVPLVTSNGTPDGNITTAGIAALLGGLRATTYTDLNDTPQGVTVGNTGSGCLNVPDGWAGGIAISANRNSIYQLQILVNYTLTKLYIRLKWGSNWNMVDLASMLNALTPIAGSVSDLNTIVNPCTTLTDRNASNAPEANKFGYLTCLKFQSYLAQIWIDMSLTKVYIRSVNASSGWSGITWKVLATITDPS